MESTSLARRAIRIFPMTEFTDRATVKANRRNWIAARRSMRATLLEDAEHTRSARVLITGKIVNLYDRHKDTMVLVVTVVGTLPLLVLDLLAMGA